MMLLDAVIFDMDGLLIDSEGLWDRALIDVFDAAEIDYSAAYFQQTRGLRVDRLVAGHVARSPRATQTAEAITEQVVARVVALVETYGQPLPGALEAVRFFKERGLPIAIASSSPCPIIEANIAALDISDDLDAVCSASDEAHGKPHPAVYLRAASLLGVPPERCLVFEDAILGVIAAKAAQMTCVCVPDAADRDDKRLGIADVVLPSLSAFDARLWQSLNSRETRV